MFSEAYSSLNLCIFVNATSEFAYDTRIFKEMLLKFM